MLGLFFQSIRSALEILEPKSALFCASSPPSDAGIEGIAQTIAEVVHPKHSE